MVALQPGQASWLVLVPAVSCVSTDLVAVSVIGGALVYVANRWVILPAIDPMMRLVPETAFFIGHLLFGLVVGLGIVIIARRTGALDEPAAGGVALA